MVLSACMHSIQKYKVLNNKQYICMYIYAVIILYDLNANVHTLQGFDAK